MRVSSLQDLFLEQLKDLYSAESQAEQACRRWAEASSSGRLTDILTDHAGNIRRHRGRIERICKDLGADPTGHTCRGMEGLVREGDAFLSEVTDDAAKDAGIVAMLNRVEHYGIAAYGCARTYALQLDYDDAAQVLQTTLDEEADIDDRLTELAESLLNERALEPA